jgi:hypothetical protein
MKFYMIAIAASMCLCVFATPTKSSVAARHLVNSGAGGDWTNPYITDGLVAMWDGEWNAGGGVHDANATTWKDLTGNGCDATLSGTYSWGDKSWNVESVSGRGLATWSIAGPFTDQTVEVVIHPTANSGVGRIMAEWNKMVSPCVRGNGVYMYGWNTDTGITIQNFNGLALHCHQLIYTWRTGFKYYVDGDMAWERSSGGASEGGTCYFANRADYGRGLDGMYYSVRIYNRALTAAEIAHNYAIDKARFNLP